METVKVHLNKLDLQSVEMMREFNKIKNEFVKLLSSQEHLIPKLHSFISPYRKLPTIYENDPEQSTIRRDLSKAKSVNQYMDIINSYCSFFNYKFLKELFNFLEYKEGKKNIELYESEFAIYLSKRKTTNCPAGIGMKGSDHTIFTIKLDNLYKDCDGLYIEELQKDICKILQLRSEQLQLEKVTQGCICVVFHLLKNMKHVVFPLSQRQLEELRSLDYFGASILQISCEYFVYNIEGKCAY